MCSHDSPIYVISYANKKKASTLLRYHLKYFKRFSTNSTVIGTVFLPLYLRPRILLIVYISSPIIIDEMAFRDSAEM